MRIRPLAYENFDCIEKSLLSSPVKLSQNDHSHVLLFELGLGFQSIFPREATITSHKQIYYLPNHKMNICFHYLEARGQGLSGYSPRFKSIPMHNQKSLSGLGILVAIVCVLSGLAYEKPTRPMLAMTKLGKFNESYYQNKQPSIEQQDQGRIALLGWSRANVWDKSRLAEQLILGNTLIGMSRVEVKHYLGRPTFVDKLDDIRLVYDVSFMTNSSDYLNISLKNDLVIQTTLSVKWGPSYLPEGYSD